MTHTDQRKESKCRLLTLLLILLVSVVGANKIDGTGSHRPIINPKNWSSLINQTSLPDKTKEGGVPTEISKVMLQNKESNQFVTIFKKGRKGVDALGALMWHNKTSKKDEYNPFAILIFTPKGNSLLPYFTIQGGANAYYLCFKKNGDLVVKVKGHSSRCEFEEKYSGYYRDSGYNRDTGYYREIVSKRFPNFKLGFKKNGSPMNGGAHSNTKKKERFMFHIKRITNGRYSCKSGHGPKDVNLCDSEFLDKVIDPKIRQQQNHGFLDKLIDPKIRHRQKHVGHRNYGKRKR